MSRRIVRMATLAAAAVLVVAVMPTAAIASEKLKTPLTGAEEVCADPTRCGDPDGFGHAALKLDAATGTVCFKITAKNIGPALAAHIHEAPAGVAGPVVVPLFSSSDGFGHRIKGCVTDVDPALIEEILANPAAFYVNVHTAEFPDGAIRGQLG